MTGKTQLTIIGLGGVGGYFGFKLAQAFKDQHSIEINFMARGKTYEVVKENGLTLLSPEHEVHNVNPNKLYQSALEIPEQQILVFCTKEYDLENLCLSLKDKVKEDTVIIPLMNGVDIYERIRKVITNGIVLPACVYVASHIKEKGIVEHKGIPGKIIIGKDPKHQYFDPIQVVDIFLKANINIVYKADPFPEIWTKFFFIASFGLVTARYNKSIGQVESEPDLHHRAQQIMEELKAIANSKNIDLPQDIVELTFQKSKNFPYDTPTSLQLDVQSKKENTELELFAGAILNLGRLMDIEVSKTQQIYEEIGGFLRHHPNKS